MSALRGESAVRGEELYGSTRGFGGGTAFDASSAFAYEPKITGEQLFNPDSVQDRDGMALRHPWAYKLCYMVPDFIWAHPLGVLDAEGETAMDNPVTAGLETLEQLHFRDAMTPVTQGDLKHGWGVLVLWQDNEKNWQSLTRAPNWVNPDVDFLQRVPGLKSIGRIDWLTPSQINKGQRMPADLMDGEGWPTKYRYYYTDVDHVDIDARRCILVRSRSYDRTHVGLPLLWPVWDTLVYSYAMFSSFGWATAKYGQTSISVPIQGSISDTQAGDTETAFQSWHKKSLLLYNGNTGKEPKFVQPEHMDPTPLLDMWLANMAIGTGFPKLWFQGEKVGAVTGSEIDTRNVTARIKQLEAQLESPVWRLLAVLDNRVLEAALEFRLEFPHEEQISEIERATWWNSTLSQAPNGLQVMSMNEYRQNVLNMGPTEGGDETPAEREQRVLKEQQQSMRFEFGGAGAKGQDEGKTPSSRGESRLGVQVPPSYSELEEAYKVYGSTQGVCRALRCSHHTISKQRQRYKEEYQQDAPF